MLVRVISLSCVGPIAVKVCTGTTTTTTTTTTTATTTTTTTTTTAITTTATSKTTTTEILLLLPLVRPLPRGLLETLRPQSKTMRACTTQDSSYTADTMIFLLKKL